MAIIHMREDLFRLQAFILRENRIKLTWEQFFMIISVFDSLHFTGIVNFADENSTISNVNASIPSMHTSVHQAFRPELYLISFVKHSEHF